MTEVDARLGTSYSGDPAHDPGAEEAARRAQAARGAERALLASPAGGVIRVGTAGWTDPTLTAAERFYPPGVTSAEDRLRYYASLFPFVEVDSTYYALPAQKNVELWVQRTPADFRMSLKAYALMTGQPSEVNRLPADLKAALPNELARKSRIYGKDMPQELEEEVWRRFKEAVQPLHDAGRLGAVLLQYPRWFHPSRKAVEEILKARDRLAPLRCSVEFRNGAWLKEGTAERTIGFLSEQKIPYVIIDGPQGLGSSIPPVAAVTCPELAIIRFHGRRADTWETANVGVLDRFRYLYEKSQLSEWTPRIAEISREAKEVHAVMNNCYANYGTTNALELAQLLREAVY